MSTSILKSIWTIRLFVLLTAIAIGWLMLINRHLKTEFTPKGILSFQSLTFQADADSAKAAWEPKEKPKEGDSGEDKLIYARRSYLVDSFLFIPSYAILLLLSMFRWNSRNKTKFGRLYKAFLVVITVMLDVVENTLSYRFISGESQWTTALPWITTFKVIFFVTSILSVKPFAFGIAKFLAGMTRYTKTVFDVIWSFRPIVLSLAILYLVLWQANQGQDLIVNLNDSKSGFTVFFIVILFLALLNWHLPKYFSYNTKLERPRRIWNWLKEIFNGSVAYNDHPVKRHTVEYVEDSDLARAFGVLTILIPAFGMLNVMEKYDLPTWGPNRMLIISTVALALLLRFNVIDNAYKNNPKYRWIIVSLIFICAGLMITFWIVNKGPADDLKWVCYSLCSLAFIFLLFTSIRRNFPDPLKNIKAAPWIMWPNVLFGVLFIFANIWPLHLARVESEWTLYSTISIFLCGLIAYMLFFSFLMFWGRSTGINIAGFFLATAIIISIVVNSRFHNVAVVKNDKPQPPFLHQYAKKWLAHHADEIKFYNEKRSRKYPIIIVSTYGGGIRAAAWTSLVIGYLDRQVNEKSKKPINGDTLNESFQDHVFAYSGASGGTIGASIMCAIRSMNPHKLISADSIASFYQRDFLSPVIVGLIGRDFIFSTFGIDGKDRSRLQEEIWECHMEKFFSNYKYGSTLSHCWNDSTYKTPLLFSNSTHVEHGLKGIVAPVQLQPADFPSATVINSLLKGTDVKLSTAAFFSARFPFISPAGRVAPFNHFLDGGIYENSGAETALEIHNVLNEVLLGDKTLCDKVEIIIVSLKNSPPQDPEIQDKNMFELSAPLNALLSNIDGSAIHADRQNEEIFKRQGRYFQIFPKKMEAKKLKDTQQINAILPLGWQLSGAALKRLRDSSEDARDEPALLRKFSVE